MKYCLLLIILNLFTNTLLSQEKGLKEIEIDLCKSYNRLFKNGFKINSNWDSLVQQNRDFRSKIEKYTSLYPQTLTYNFDSLANTKVKIISAEDQCFRIYSWDTWSGGTLHYFENALQYKINDSVFSKIMADTSEYGENYIPYYSQIFTLKSQKETFYLAIGHGIYSNKDHSETLQIFSIKDGYLNDTVQLIKTEEGLRNSITVFYNFFSVVDRSERPVQTIKYKAEHKTISIPIIKDENEVTDKYILYKFTGKYFEKVETSEN